MRTINLSYVLVVLSIFFNSCQKNDFDRTLNSEEKSEVSAKYDKDKNLLYFADKQELENFINSYETNKNDIYSFYDDGFIPFEPIEGIDEQQFKNLVAYKNDILNKKIGLGLEVFWRKVDKVSLDIEAGALYDGKWGGSKFIVKE